LANDIYKFAVNIVSKKYVSNSLLMVKSIFHAGFAWPCPVKTSIIFNRWKWKSRKESLRKELTQERCY